MAWIPYYSRIAFADAYVVLDNVGFRRHFFHDRTLFLNPTNVKQYSRLPTNGSQNMLIKDVQLINPSYYITKIFKNITINYRKKAFFNEFFERFMDNRESFLSCEKLIDFNLVFLRFILNILEIKEPVIKFSSELSFSSDKNNRIIEICNSLKKYRVVVGWGASVSIHDNDMLAKHGIKLVPCREDPFKRLINDYNMIDGVSIIDFLVRKGISRTQRLFAELNNIYSELLKNYD